MVLTELLVRAALGHLARMGRVLACLVAAGLLCAAPATWAQSLAPADSANAHAEALKIYRSGERSRALARVDKGLATDPKDTQLRFLRGVLLTELGRHEDAITLFRQMTQDFPELPEPYNNLAVLQAGGGDLDAARETLEMSNRVLPSYGLAHENLGDIYLRLAQRAWEHAEFLNPAQASRMQERLSLARELIARDLASRNLASRSQEKPTDPPRTRYLRGLAEAPSVSSSRPAESPARSPAGSSPPSTSPDPVNAAPRPSSLKGLAP
jgi:tetratricopeptide (TPR) repeat protein